MREFVRILAPRAGETLLDLGGTPWFWAGSGLEADITLFNLSRPVPAPPQTGRLHFVEGDACMLPFPDKSFDIVFSNSAIEHVGSWERQRAFSREALRVGRRLWVQTPAREFPVEPHLLTPFIHWLPRPLQRRMVRNFTLRGWIDRPDGRAVEEFLREVRLLTHSEIRVLFPDCVVLRERFLGMTKSYIAIRT
jgi:SAM-dependent methyltransferase